MHSWFVGWWIILASNLICILVYINIEWWIIKENGFSQRHNSSLLLRLHVNVNYTLYIPQSKSMLARGLCQEHGLHCFLSTTESFFCAIFQFKDQLIHMNTLLLSSKEIAWVTECSTGGLRMFYGCGRSICLHGK